MWKLFNKGERVIQGTDNGAPYSLRQNTHKEFSETEGARLEKLFAGEVIVIDHGEGKALASQAAAAVEAERIAAEISARESEEKAERERIASQAAAAVEAEANKKAAYDEGIAAGMTEDEAQEHAAKSVE